ncbi:MAG: type II toxin-antitoxin system VapC family toxin [Syntrophobacter sp.]
MIGLDTGFFIEFLRGNSTSVSVWKALIEDREEAVVSCLTLSELEMLSLKRGIEGATTLLEAIPAVCTVLWLRDNDILSRAAALSHGLGISAVDSLILAGFLAERVRVIYTTDVHFESYRKKGIKVINLKLGS